MVSWELARVLGFVMVVMTGCCLVLSVRVSRRESRLRPGLDAARVLVSAAGVFGMMLITGVPPDGALLAVMLAAGVAVGWLQGRSTQARVDNGRVMCRKSAVGVAAWSIGVVFMQVAALANRAGTVELGQSISWLGIGMLVGTMVGRQPRIAAAMQQAALVGATALVCVLAIPGAAPRSVAQSEGRWVLTETLANPYGQPTEFVVGVTPGFYESPRFDGSFSRYTVTELGISSHHRWVEREFQYYDATFDVVFDAASPAEMEPDEVVSLEASGSANGVYEADSNIVEHFEFRVEMVRSDTDQGAPVALDGQPDMWLGINPAGAPSSGRVTPNFVVPPVAEGLELRISAGFWNCAACSVEWRYTSVPTSDELVVAPPPPVAPATEPVASEPPDTESGPSPAVDDQDVIQPDEAAPSEAGDVAASDADSDITPSAAVGTAIGGLIAATAIGLISLSDADVAIGAAVRRGGGGGRTSRSRGTAAPVPPGAGAGVTTPASVPTRSRRTVYVSGAAAEAVLQAGTGATVAIPTDQQWDENVSFDGSTKRSGRVGSVGVVREIGPVIRGTDGSVSIAVEVDAYDPPPPPPPSPRRVVAPVNPLPKAPPTKPPPKDLAPLNPLPRTPPPSGPPGGAPPADRYTDDEMWDAIDRGMDDVTGIDEAPDPPPIDEAPPEPSPAADRYTDDEMWDAIDRGMDDVAGIDEAPDPPPIDEAPPEPPGPGWQARGPGDRSQPRVGGEYDNTPEPQADRGSSGG